MYTEEQAKRLWCPFARVQEISAADGRAQPIGGGHNRLSLLVDGEQKHTLSDNGYCVASNCAAWRWTVQVATELEPNVRSRGYCGLAGQPS